MASDRGGPGPSECGPRSPGSERQLTGLWALPPEFGRIGGSWHGVGAGNCSLTVYCMSEVEICRAAWDLLSEGQTGAVQLCVSGAQKTPLPIAPTSQPDPEGMKQEEASFTPRTDPVKHRGRASSPLSRPREHPQMSPRVRINSPPITPTPAQEDHALKLVKDIFF